MDNMLKPAYQVKTKLSRSCGGERRRASTVRSENASHHWRRTSVLERKRMSTRMMRVNARSWSEELKNSGGKNPSYKELLQLHDVRLI
jgi:hypothetical protein